ncbi:TPA: metallophosphoesterase [Streptococcus suis]
MAYDFKSLTKQADEASNRGKFYTDFEDVDPNVLHQISDLTEWIRTKGKGSDVREIIAQLFERTWLEATKEGNANMEVAKARGYANTLVERLDQMELADKSTAQDISVVSGQIENLIANAGNGTVPSELTDMRVANDGKIYKTAGEALRVQLSEKATVSTVNLLSNDWHYHAWINSDDLVPKAYTGWAWIHIQLTKQANETFGLYRTIPSTQELDVSGYLVYNKSGLANNVAYGKLSAYNLPIGTTEFYLAVDMRQLKNGLVLCDTRHAEKISEADSYQNVLLSPSGKATVLDSFEILAIQNPYLYIHGSGQATFKFSEIIYRHNDTVFNYTFKDLKRDAINGLAFWEYNYDMDRDCIYISDSNKILVLDAKAHAIKLVDSVTDGQLVLLNQTAGNLTGLLKDFFDKSQKDKIVSLLGDQLTLEMIEKISEKEDVLVKDLTPGGFTFAFMTDNHQNGFLTNAQVDYSALALAKVVKDLPPTTILHGGDTVLSTGSNQNALRKVFNGINASDVLYCEGNHDRYIHDPILPKKDFHNIMYTGLHRDPDVHFGRLGEYPGSYYYKDFNNHKIRIVVLDLYSMPLNPDGSEMYNYNDHNGYCQDQLKWLVDTALRVNEDWHVLVMTHSSPFGPEDGMTNNTGGQGNRQLLPQILEAFKYGRSVLLRNTKSQAGFEVNFTADFTNQGARHLAGVFTGHNHTDVILQKNGINYISTASGYIDRVLYFGKLGQRYQHTYSAIAFDYCILDTTTRSIKLRRFGWGDDREFKY